MLSQRENWLWTKYSTCRRRSDTARETGRHGMRKLRHRQVSMCFLQPHRGSLQQLYDQMIFERYVHRIFSELQPMCHAPRLRHSPSPTHSPERGIHRRHRQRLHRQHRHRNHQHRHQHERLCCHSSPHTYFSADSITRKHQVLHSCSAHTPQHATEERSSPHARWAPR